MGHHQFDSISKSKSPNIETNIADEVEGMNLNGLQRVTQEHQQLVEQVRHRLRDRISSRMGELLLLGHTMLNEYCELCAGILMENHRGIRSCVTCEMVNTELSVGDNSSSAVSNNDHLNGLNNVATEYGSMSGSVEVLQSPAQFPLEDSPARPSCTDFLRSRNVKSALEAVDDKLKWCAERLKSCENTEEVLKLYETIDRGIGILKHFTGT